MSTQQAHQRSIAAALASRAEVHTGRAGSPALPAESSLGRIDILKFTRNLGNLVTSGRIDRDTHNVILWKLKGAVPRMDSAQQEQGSGI